MPALNEGQDDGSGGDEDSTSSLRPGEAFAQEKSGEDEDEYNAELVDWSDFRRLSDLEGTKVAQPREAGADA